MNYFDEVKGRNMKTYLSFENKKEDKKENIGGKLEDFEIIKLMGKGQFGKVFKVISKLNNEVYAMKMIDLKNLKSNALRLALNESKYLTVLSHPHIMKYYTNFTDDDKLYLIIENAENGDMTTFLNANRKMGRHIPEDELWSIFLQCMQGLTYIHDMGVIHRDIKPGNILMDNNMTVKIGDFGTCAVKKNKENENKNIEYLNAEYRDILNEESMQSSGTIIISKGFAAKEMMEKREYDQKIDVYSMGVTFYLMCYYVRPNRGIKEEDLGYSKEMLDIINEMLEEDKNKRKPSKYFLEKIQNEFSKRYYRNTSIDAIVRCLYSFDEMTNYYKNLNELEIKKRPITKAYIQCLKNFNNQNIDVYFNSIKYFREVLCTENTKFDKTKEINPKLVFAFLISQLHKEMNINISLNNKSNNYYMTSGIEEAKTSKVEMLLNFENKFFPQLNTFISQKISGLLKNAYICSQCQIKTFSFSGYFFITLDLEDLSQYILPDIENYFNYKKTSSKVVEKYCPKCLKKTEHDEYNQYYTCPDYLVVIINRGNNDACRMAVKLKEKMDLTNLIEMQAKKYKLVGFINKNYETETYASFFEYKSYKKWFKCEANKIHDFNQMDSTNILNDVKGKIMMAFYEAIY